MVEIISEFSKLHMYDDHCDYKTAWAHWVAANAVRVEAETQRLVAAGYEGDAVDKMYKAGRYYFRTKRLTSKKDLKPRRVYVGTSREMLDMMDTFIQDDLSSPLFNSPAKTYQLFLESEQARLRHDEELLYLTKVLPRDEAADKLKKTFKNRYYRMTR
jgi:hypothetical protein